MVLLGRGEEALARWLPTDTRERQGLRVAAASAMCLAHLGRHDEARALMAPHLPDPLTPVEEDETPAGELSLLLEAATLIQDREACRVLAERLEPVAHVAFIDYRNQACMARHLGAAAALLGEPDRAKGYYRQALEVCQKIRFRPEIALTRLGLAELLLENYPDEKPAALQDLDFAIAEFREMKMQPSLERALKHKGLLTA